MYNVKIYGAGSIGNHLAHACRQKDWNVLITDKDSEALERTKNDIYPSRYGKWDDKIRLIKVSDLPNEIYDIVIIGTPPESHLSIALEILKKNPPKVLLIEKPLCTPDLNGCDELYKLSEEKECTVLVGYNHNLTKNTQIMEELISKNIFGKAISVNSKVREYWGGIFNAHPWLDGPKDSYLGYIERGGGACLEHSHSISLWLYVSSLLNFGKVVEVTALMDIVNNGTINYDRLSQINFKTENGYVGLVVQDVITEPAQKFMRIQGDKGFIEWYVNKDKKHDAVIYWDGKNEIKEELISKTRPDDFKWEIEHVEKILNEEITDSPISLKRGLEIMLVIAAAFKSNKEGKKVTINYSKGYNLDAVN